jgi:two-component system, cell cycle sensor histidine kinase and response regulator CckA
MTPSPPSAVELQREIEELRRRLAEAEEANEALTKGQIDAVVDEAHQAPVLLRQAQDALQASELRYREIFEYSSECIFLLDVTSDGRFQISGFNPAEERAVGLSNADVSGKFVDDAFPEAIATQVIAKYRRCVETGMPMSYDEALDLPIGRRFFRTVLVPVRNSAGHVYRIVGIANDNTEHKRAESLREAAYRISEAAQSAGSLHDFFQQAHEIVSTLVPARNFYVALLDPETGMITFPYFVDEVDPPPAPRLPGRSLTDHVIRTGEPLLASRDVFDGLVARGEVELIGAHSVDWLGVALKAPGGTLGAVVVQTYTAGVRFSDSDRDLLTFISGQLAMAIQRKRAGEALRESEERYRVLFDGSPLPMYLYDQETLAIAEVNEAAVLHYGYSREEFLSKTLREIWHPDQGARAAASLPASSGEPRSTVRRHVKKGGASITAEVSSHAVLFAGRSYRLSVIRDITDQRELEERFRQSQKMEAVGRLAGGVAHDFNNLLTVILGYSDVLLQGLEPGSLLEATQEVRRAGERAAALTRQLLAFSRKQTLVSEVLDLGDVVSGLSTMVERLIGEDIKVSVVVSPGLGRVKADRGQLEQVVVNLAVNARDAMPKGGSLIFELQNVELDDAYTATHAEVEPGPYMLLAISDTGTGMDAETQKRIFEPFFTTKEAGKGTGLGLSTVHGIVHQSGGTIDVYSEPGRGTTFKVYLPLFAGDEAVPRALSGINPALAAASETVLVVEDEAAIRQLTNLILQKAGYTVLLAESPVAAERIAGSHPAPIDLMLTDVVMPDMRGPELAERLLRLRPDLRVLYMSGYTDDAIAHHGMLDAGTEFLQKPFTSLQLTQKVREVLGRSER